MLIVPKVIARAEAFVQVRGAGVGNAVGKVHLLVVLPEAVALVAIGACV